MPKQPNILDQVAQDLADWIDTTAQQIADSLTAGGSAPFAAQVTEAQKLAYYRAQLFNPDGTPNLQGRQAQMTRLGPESFSQVFKAVLNAYPELRVPAPPEGAPIPTNMPETAGPAPGPRLQGLPANLGIPRGAGLLPQGDVGAPVPVGGPLG
jgi:hypothetical protein